jgi:hypothetical protein
MKGGDHMEDIGVDERIILQWMLERWGGEVWTGCIWLTVGTNGGLL